MSRHGLFHRPPIQDAELDGEKAVVFVQFGTEGQIELADGQGQFSGIPPNGFARDLPVADPKFYVALVGADPLQRPGLMHVAQQEAHRRIADAAMFDFLQLAELAEGEHVVWNFHFVPGFSLPEEKVFSEIVAAAKRAQINLIVDRK